MPDLGRAKQGCSDTTSPTHQRLGSSELSLRPAEKHPVVIPSFHKQRSNWKQFPKPAPSCDSGLCPHSCQVPHQAGTGPWHSPQSLPKVSQQGSWDSSYRKTNSWRTPSTSSSTVRTGFCIPVPVTAAANSCSCWGFWQG